MSIFDKIAARAMKDMQRQRRAKPYVPKPYRKMVSWRAPEAPKQPTITFNFNQKEPA